MTYNKQKRVDMFIYHTHTLMTKLLNSTLALLLTVVLLTGNIPMPVKQVNASFSDHGVGFAEYYMGIEQNPRDFGIHGIFKFQKENGSVCMLEGNCIRETYFVLKSMKNAGLEDAKIDQAYTYLTTLAVPKTTTEETYILEAKYWQGVDIRTSLTSLIARVQAGNGYAMKEGYEADVLSSTAILRLMNHYSSSYATERTNLENYLTLNCLNGSLFFFSGAEPDFYLNVLLLDAVASTSSTLKTCAKNIIVSDLQNTERAVDMEAEAFSYFLNGQLPEIDKAIFTDLKNKLVGWQNIDGLIRSNIVTTALFVANNNVVPTIQIVQPDGVSDGASNSFTISWNAADPDDDAVINLYYDTDNTGQDGYPINMATISEDTFPGEFVWDTTNVTDGSYYVYAEIDDGVNAPVIAYSAGVVTISHQGGCSIPSTGTWTVTESCSISTPVTAPGDVIVMPNAIITIEATGQLHIDLKQYKLLVKKDGGVLILHGGKVTQTIYP